MIAFVPDKDSDFWSDPTIFENSTGTILDCIHRGIQGKREDKLKLILVYRMYLSSEQFTQLILIYFRHIAGNSLLEDLWLEFVELWMINCFHCDFNRPVRSLMAVSLNSLKEYKPEMGSKLIRVFKYQKMLLGAVFQQYKKSDTSLKFQDWLYDNSKSSTSVLEKAFKGMHEVEEGSEDDEEEDDKSDKRGSFSSRLSFYFKRLSVMPSINNSDLQDIEWLLNYSSESIADHLYITDYNNFTKIPFADLLYSPVAIQPYKKSSSKDESNLGLFVDRFNRICQVVSSAVYATKSSKLVRKFVHIADHCYRYNNCMSLMAIILGLQSPDLDALGIWSKVAKEDLDRFEFLKNLCSPLNNFKKLREYTEKIMVEKHAIPFVGLYISDIVFMKEVDSYLSDHISVVGEGYEIPSLNLRKFYIVSDRISEFYKFQSKDCIETQLDEQLLDICQKL
eukprot:NODE_173_length_14219_cov_0.603824.p3 type:complete len:450 gc:universal NODE_173_length_14219_cov_0.603824:11445-10096(-)